MTEHHRRDQPRTRARTAGRRRRSRDRERRQRGRRSGVAAPPAAAAANAKPSDAAGESRAPATRSAVGAAASPRGPERAADGELARAADTASELQVRDVRARRSGTAVRPRPLNINSAGRGPRRVAVVQRFEANAHLRVGVRVSAAPARARSPVISIARLCERHARPQPRDDAEPVRPSRRWRSAAACSRTASTTGRRVSERRRFAASRRRHRRHGRSAMIRVRRWPDRRRSGLPEP